MADIIYSTESQTNDKETFSSIESRNSRPVGCQGNRDEKAAHCGTR